MSNEVLPFASNHVIDLLQEASNNNIADVLRPWDCYAQKWADKYMRLFRFENNDVLIWSENDALQGCKGAVDSRTFDLLHLIYASNNPAEDMCLCWRSDPDYRSIIGRQLTATELLSKFF